MGLIPFRVVVVKAPLFHRPEGTLQATRRWHNGIGITSNTSGDEMGLGFGSAYFPGLSAQNANNARSGKEHEDSIRVE